MILANANGVVNDVLPSLDDLCPALVRLRELGSDPLGQPGHDAGYEQEDRDQPPRYGIDPRTSGRVTAG